MQKLDKFKNFLTASSFVQRAYEEVEALSNYEYHLRKGDGIKKLVEEILPLAAFLKHFERPGAFIKCRFFLKSQHYDAKIALKGYYVDKGFLEASYFIEVTTAEERPKAYLIRKALTLYGAIGGYNISEIGSKKKGTYRIVGDGAHDVDAPVEDAIKWIKAALKNKYGKKSYPSPCILLVQIEPARPLSLHEWSTVIKEIRNTIDEEKFRATYIVNWETNTVLKV